MSGGPGAGFRRPEGGAGSGFRPPQGGVAAPRNGSRNRPPEGGVLSLGRGVLSGTHGGAKPDKIA